MRKALLRYAPVLIAGAVLAGCTHSVDLVPLDGGRAGVGDVGLRGRTMTVRYEGKTYSGAFVPASAPQIAALAPRPGQPEIGSRVIGVQGVQGSTGAVLTAKDGASLTCRFSYDAPDLIGSGLCRGHDGRNFALRMR